MFWEYILVISMFSAPLFYGALHKTPYAIVSLLYIGLAGHVIDYINPTFGEQLKTILPFSYMWIILILYIISWAIYNNSILGFKHILTIGRKIDIVFLLFISLSLLSSIYAQNPLLSIKRAFSWIILYVLVKTIYDGFRKSNDKQKYIDKFFTWPSYLIGIFTVGSFYIIAVKGEYTIYEGYLPRASGLMGNGVSDFAWFCGYALIFVSWMFLTRKTNFTRTSWFVIALVNIYNGLSTHSRAFYVIFALYLLFLPFICLKFRKYVLCWVSVLVLFLGGVYVQEWYMRAADEFGAVLRIEDTQRDLGRVKASGELLRELEGVEWLGGKGIGSVYVSSLAGRGYVPSDVISYSELLYELGIVGLCLFIWLTLLCPFGSLFKCIRGRWMYDANGYCVMMLMIYFVMMSFAASVILRPAIFMTQLFCVIIYMFAELSMSYNRIRVGSQGVRVRVGATEGA